MMQKSYFPYILISTLFVMIVSACTPSAKSVPTQDLNAIYTQAAATIAMEYTQTALAIPTNTNTPEPTFTPIALESPTLQPLVINTTPTTVFVPTYAGPTPIPVDPATAHGCYNATLVADVTVPTGTEFDPGDTFQKTWRLANTGTCDWTSDFKITYVGGNLLGSDTTKIRQKVVVGGTGDISLNMVAPNEAGTVVSNWQMATDSGNLFGPVLTIAIKLPGGASTSSSSGCYNATLVSDVTIPDGTKMDPGDTFTKTWEIENSGTCDWTRDFKITFVGGDLFGSDTTKIRRKVVAGSTTEISLPMVAPNGVGSVTSSWQMADDSGVLFGQIFTIQIVLK